MRVRIVRPLTGIIDRQSLSHFMPGFVYDVAPFIAFQMIEMNGAVEEPFPETAQIADDSGLDDLEGPFIGGVHVLQPDTAHNRTRRKRR